MPRTEQTVEREEEADAMLSSTRFARGVAPALVAAFLGTLLIVPLVQKFGRSENVKVENTPLLSTHKLPTGEELRAVETRMEDESVVFSQSRPRTQELLTRYLRAGNGQVIVGTDNWLFYDREIRSITGRAFPVQTTSEEAAPSGKTDDLKKMIIRSESVPAILNMRDQLAHRNIELIVMPIPVKATIYPEKLWPSYKESDQLPRNVALKKWKQTLQENGVRVLDVTPDLILAKKRGEAVFVPTDTHWTPRGAEIAAQKLSETLTEMKVLPPRAPSDFIRTPINERAPDDLVRLLGLPKDQVLFPRRPITCNAVYNRVGQSPRAQQDADILVLGDSFTGFYEAGGAALPQQLAFLLKRPVDWLTVANGGSYMSRVKLIQEAEAGRNHLAGKRVVVLEFTVRDLSFGNWKILNLPQ